MERSELNKRKEYEVREDYDDRSDYDERPDRSASKMPLSRQENAITTLHDIIGTLEAKLSQVLAPEHEATDKRVVEPDDGISPLYLQLSANNRGIVSANEKLMRIIERLEC